MADLLNKRQFAKVAGLSVTRIGQLIDRGLPVEANRKIDADKGKAWIRDNLDPKRRAAAKPEVDALPGDEGKLGILARLRGQKMVKESRILDIELRKREGALVDKAEVENAIFLRARFERDAWIGWAARVSVQLAADTGTNPSLIFAALDKAVRDHLAELSASSDGPD